MPLLQDMPEDDFFPFDDRAAFECGQLLFEKMQASQGDIGQLNLILRAMNILDGRDPQEGPLFENADDLLSTIDAIRQGDVQWSTFTVRFSRAIPANEEAQVRRIHAQCAYRRREHGGQR